MNNQNMLFEGADIVVCKPGTDTCRQGLTVLETVHAEEVSGLFFALKELFAGSLDFYNKYEFYRRLAEAAVAQTARGDDLEGLRGAIISEACRMASEMGEHLYFAYGSNMDADQMSDRCPDALFAGTAVLEGHTFVLDSTGAATVLEEKGSDVSGVLWLVSGAGERALDRYEGVASGCYHKDKVSVSVADGCELRALAYISDRDAHDGKSYRTGYMDNIIRCARELGFSSEYIGHLESR